MNPNTLLYYRSAIKLKLPVSVCGTLDGIRITLGKQNYYFFDYSAPWNNSASTYICINKWVTNALMREANIPVPKSTTIAASEFNLDNLKNIISDLKFPLVLKPFLWAAKGKSVVCNIPTFSSLYTICEQMLKIHPFLMIEEFHGNLKDYRVLIFKGRILAVVARFPANVIGNGKDSIKKLVQDKNEIRSRTNDILKNITLGHEASFCLAEQNLTLDSIPEKGRRVQLGYACNTTQGGEIEYVSTAMCKENKKLFLKTAAVLNLTLVGLDVACKSLDEPIEGNDGYIIEANKNPSMRLHEEDVGGVPPKRLSINIVRALIYKHPFAYCLHLCKLYKYRVSLFLLIILSMATASICLFNT